MIIPIELFQLGTRNIYVSPDLALGWRIGVHARETFDGLKDVRVAAREAGEATKVLSMMMRQEDIENDIIAVNKYRPWDFLCYHPQTGTAMEYKAIADSTRLPAEISALESDLCRRGTRMIEIYKAEVDRLIRKLIFEPIENLCVIRQRRFRHIKSRPSALVDQRCPRCNQELVDGSFWDVDEAVCCLSCCGLEGSWVMCH